MVLQIFIIIGILLYTTPCPVITPLFLLPCSQILFIYSAKVQPWRWILIMLHYMFVCHVLTFFMSYLVWSIIMLVQSYSSNSGLVIPKYSALIYIVCIQNFYNRQWHIRYFIFYCQGSRFSAHMQYNNAGNHIFYTNNLHIELQRVLQFCHACWLHHSIQRKIDLKCINWRKTLAAITARQYVLKHNIT